MNRYNQEKALSDFRVGLISFAALFFLIMGVSFAGGDKGLLFGKSSSIHAWLMDVGGLKKGSSVTMGGMTIGKVTDIRFCAVQDGLIEISMIVNSKFRHRVKTDSVPSIRTQGMLGDRYVEISMGSDSAKLLPEGQPLVGKGASDFDTTLKQTSAVLTETQKLLTAVNQKEGTMGRIFYDEKLYTTLTQVSETMNEILKDFKQHPRRYVKLSLL